jgi:hypothetical protein
MANPAARRGKVCSNSLLGKGLGTQNTASIRKVHLSALSYPLPPPSSCKQYAVPMFSLELTGSLSRPLISIHWSVGANHEEAFFAV